APSFFTEAHTPWGSAIDYRVKEVRAFAIENALHWLRDYRFDGLRLDAVNSIVEPGGLSLLHDLSAAAGKLAAENGRHIHLVLENGDNRASLLDATLDPPRGKYRAQWNDDYHHVWHVLVTGEAQGYYGDYQRSPVHDLAKALASGFVYQGGLAEAVRKGRHREYAWAYAKYGNEIPDPLAESTFRSAILDWESRNDAAGKKRLALVRELLAIRRREIVPRLAGASFGDAHAADNSSLTAHWRMGDGATLQLVANLSNNEIASKASAASGTPIWGGEADDL